jgi:hypothetical protein
MVLEFLLQAERFGSDYHYRASVSRHEQMQ